MIRYVLVLVIAAVILALTGAALDEVSTVRGEQAIEGELSAVESTASSLYDLDGSSAGVGTPRRVVDIDLPEGRRTRAGTSFLRFERIPDADATRVTYRTDGGTNRTRVIDVPIQRADGDPVVLVSDSGTLRLVFELGTDADGDPVVLVSEYDEKPRSDPAT